MYLVPRELVLKNQSNCHHANYHTLARNGGFPVEGEGALFDVLIFPFFLSTTANDVSTTTYSASLPRDPQKWLIALFSLQHHRIKLQNVIQFQNSRNHVSTFSAIPPVFISEQYGFQIDSRGCCLRHFSSFHLAK